MTLIATPCPVCGATASVPVYPGTIPEPDVAPERYFSSSRAITGYLPIVRCLGCGLVQTSPHDDDATLQQIYTGLADSTYAAEDGNRRHTARAYLAQVARFCPPPAAVLDVGCATGLFVCEAQAAGWHATGLEASAWAIQQAQSQCPAAAWVTGLLEDVDFPEGRFAAITLWDVLEHIPHPADALQRVRRWLAPRGWLFLNLPNAESTLARLTGPRWMLLLREHLWYFSPATLTPLLQKTGFTLVATRPHSVRFSLGAILGRLAQYPLLDWLAAQRLKRLPLLHRLALPFPMGEMLVAAQRREA